MAKSFQKNNLIPVVSLSTFILFFILLFVLVLPSFKWANILDKPLFQFSASFLPATETVNEVQIIHLPNNVFSQPKKTQQLIQLFQHIKNAKASSIGLLSEVLPMQDFTLKTAKNRKHKIISRSHGVLNQLALSIKQHHIVLSLNQASHQQIYQSDINIDIESGYESNYLQLLPDIFLPYQEKLHINTSVGLYPYNILPAEIRGENDGNMALIWATEKPKPSIIPSFPLVLLTQHLKSKKIIWQQAEGINLESRFIKSGIRSHVYYIPEASRKQALKINSLSLIQALQAKPSIFKNKIVLIGTDLKSLSQLNNQLNSLLSNNIITTPAWLFMISQALLFLLFLYLILIPGFHHNSGHILSLFFMLLAAVTQYSLLLSQHIWIPLGGFYLFLLLGHVVVQFNIVQQYKINRIRQQSYNAFWKLGEYQFYQGDYEKSLTSLTQCKTNNDVLALLYDIGQNFERRRQYERATYAYSEIHKRHKNYLDIKNRLQTLKKVTRKNQDGFSSMQSSETLVLENSGLELPELGRYKIERELGRGAMGVVYLGRDPKINRQVAIKTLNFSLFNREEIKAVKQRFYREAEAAGRLNHPNIVTVYDLGEEDDFSFIAMDYVQGKSLGEYTRSDKLLPVEEVLRIAIEVAQTLDYAHEQNIVHRDIKPSNIMYDEKTGKIKITDFGIARITDNVKTRTGSFMGSPSYMSPEQMTAQHVDGTSDIYALGVSLYQLLTGQLPYIADSLGNLAYKITHEKHRPIREIRDDLPSFITRIINKSLQKDPQKRYQTGQEMAQAIKRNLTS